MGVIEAEALARKKDPGPLHKYNLNEDGLSKRIRSPFYVHMAKSQGRLPKNESTNTIKKDKTPGPTSYQTEKAIKKLAGYHPI